MFACGRRGAACAGATTPTPASGTAAAAAAAAAAALLAQQAEVLDAEYKQGLSAHAQQVAGWLGELRAKWRLQRAARKAVRGACWTVRACMFLGFVAIV